MSPGAKAGMAAMWEVMQTNDGGTTKDLIITKPKSRCACGTTIQNDIKVLTVYHTKI